MDRRARLRPKTPVEDLIYGYQGLGAETIGSTSTAFTQNAEVENLLIPLIETDGLMWPYTPTINFTGSINYDSVDMTHTNQEFKSYRNTRSPNIMVAGNFTAQNPTEARYLLACIHFLRVISKMSFGQNNSVPVGTPPPILLFSAYGQYQFNNLPVIVESFTIDYPPNIDYVEVLGTKSWVGVEQLITVQLVVQNTPQRLKRDFNLEEFRTGQLLKKGGWI